MLLRRVCLASEYLIGIDAGTSVVKCVLYDTSGRQVERAAMGTEIAGPRQGGCERDMHILASQVVPTLANLAGKVRCAARKTKALGLTAQGDATWLIDAQGQPVRPALLWLDSMAAPALRRWQD